MRMRLIFLLTVAAVAAALACPMASEAGKAGAWYWSPGLCKSNLQQYGMRIDDGRTFRIAQAFCVGRGGLDSCEWNASYTRRLYNHFVAFARAYDGVIRGFDVYPTNRSNYRAEGIELASSHRLTAARFASLYGSISSSLARVELEKGCARNS
jgi:hypothetical protein